MQVAAVGFGLSTAWSIVSGVGALLDGDGFGIQGLVYGVFHLVPAYFLARVALTPPPTHLGEAAEVVRHHRDLWRAIVVVSVAAFALMSLAGALVMGGLIYLIQSGGLGTNAFS